MKCPVEKIMEMFLNAREMYALSRGARDEKLGKRVYDKFEERLLTSKDTENLFPRPGQPVGMWGGD
jgi:hypothetical protein